MSTQFDIFLTETGGSVRWVAAVRTFEEAKRRVQAIASRSPGEYFVFNQETASKINLERDGAAEIRCP